MEADSFRLRSNVCGRAMRQETLPTWVMHVGSSLPIPAMPTTLRLHRSREGARRNYRTVHAADRGWLQAGLEAATRQMVWIFANAPGMQGK